MEYPYSMVLGNPWLSEYSYGTRQEAHVFFEYSSQPWLGGTFVNSPGCLSLTIRILRKPLGSLYLGHENVHMARIEIA